MSDENSLRLSIDPTEAEDGAKRFKVATDQINNATVKLSETQKQVNSQFKTAGFDNQSLQRLKTQLQAAGDPYGDLQKRLYAATHTSQETALKASADYFAEMKTQYHGNESMLTLISKTESAERQKIIESYTSSALEKYKWLNKSLGVLVKGGAFVAIADSMVIGLTKAHEAARTGGSAFNGFVDAIPILGSVNKALREMAFELSGVTEHRERLKEVQNALKAFEPLQIDIGSQLLSVQTPETLQPALQALHQYESTLRTIKTLEDEAAAASKKRIKQLEEEMASAPAQQQFAGGRAVGLTKSWYADRIAAIKAELAGLPDYEGKATDAMKIFVQTLQNIKTKPIDDMTASLREQIDTINMTAGEIAVYKAAIRMDSGSGFYEVPSKEEQAKLDNIREMADSLEQLKREKTAAADAISLAHKRAEATAQMYSDMKNYGQEYYSVELQLLEMRKQEYLKIVQDEVLAEKWKLNQIQKLAEERHPMLKYYNDLKRDMADDPSRFIEGKFVEAAGRVEGAWSDAFYNMIQDGASFKDAMEGLAEGIMQAFNRMAADMMARMIMFQIMQGGGFGGMGDSTSTASLVAAGATLNTAGVSLNTAAVSLTAAAASLTASAGVNAAGGMAGAAGSGFNFLSMLGGMGGSGGQTPSVDSVANTAALSWMMMAKGGILNRGSIMPFARGDIFDKPTYFPMSAGRTGLMGENGPEAVMPLTRDRNGRLGVKSDQPAANNGTTVNLVTHFSITSMDSKDTLRAIAPLKRHFVNWVKESLGNNHPLRRNSGN